MLALGAVTADFGVAGVADHAFGLKSAQDATSIRTHVLRRFEDADQLGNSIDVAAATTIVVAGGGPTGVEMAGGFAELIDRVLRRDFPAVDVDGARVILIEGEDRLLGTFAPRLARVARERLEKMGVEVLLGRQVAAVREHEVELDDGSVISTDTMVWAAGVRAHPLAQSIGLATGRAGRVLVDDHLRLLEHPEVFVVGDLAAASMPDGSLVPQVAAAAVQGGRHVANTISADLAGRSTEAFVYRDKGSMATVGRNAAVVELPNGLKITGWLGWIAWLMLHLLMLIGFRNRANVLVNWAWNYLTYDRGSRIIVEPDEE